MWEAFRISVWMLRQSEMLRVKRSEETQTKQSKSTFQVGFIKACRDVKANRLSRHFFLVRELVFIDSNLVQTFPVSVLGNPLFKSVWWRPKVIEMWFWRCRGKQNTEFRFYNKCRPLQCVFILSSRVHGRLCILTVFIRRDVHTCSHACQLPDYPPPQKPISHTSDSFPFLFPSLHPSSSMLFHRHKPMFCFVFSPLCF